MRDSLNYQALGTPRQWRREFETVLKDNPLLVFMACLPFMPPLLRFAHLEGCTFALVGETSTGRSTALELAGSIRGGQPSEKLGFRETWATTPGALQLLAIKPMRPCCFSTTLRT